MNPRIAGMMMLYSAFMNMESRVRREYSAMNVIELSEYEKEKIIKDYNKQIEHKIKHLPKKLRLKYKRANK